MPFLPFSEDEQLAVVHKAFHELSETVKKPIDLTRSTKTHIGHCDFHMSGDGEVCEQVARRFYDQETGARSLKKGVTETIQSGLYREYVKRPRVWEDINEEPLQQFTTLLPSSGNNVEVDVVRDSSH